MNGVAVFTHLSIFTYICCQFYVLNSPSSSFYSELQMEKSTAVTNCIRINEEYSLQKC